MVSVNGGTTISTQVNTRGSNTSEKLCYFAVVSLATRRSKVKPNCISSKFTISLIPLSSSFSITFIPCSRIFISLYESHSSGFSYPYNLVPGYLFHPSSIDLSLTSTALQNYKRIIINSLINIRIPKIDCKPD